MTEPYAESDMRRLFAELKSQEFALSVSAASGVATAVRAVQSQSATQELIRCVSRTRDASPVLEFLREVAAAAVDMRYSSPYDVAILAALVALHHARRTSVAAAASIALRAPQTWWARRVSLALLQPPHDLPGMRSQVNAALVMRGEMNESFPGALPIFAQKGVAADSCLVADLGLAIAHGAKFADADFQFGAKGSKVSSAESGPLRLRFGAHATKTFANRVELRDG